MTELFRDIADSIENYRTYRQLYKRGFIKKRYSYKEIFKAQRRLGYEERQQIQQQ